MTFSSDARQFARRPALEVGLGASWGTFLLALGATALTLVTNASGAAFALRGGFADPDDAMRLVEVRAWLTGQGWYDVVAHRLDPPLGASMHWSRLVDLPTSALIRLFSCTVDTATAEHWACVTVPTLWLLGLYLAMSRLAAVLVGSSASPITRVTALLGTLFSGAALISFVPGRIGHHGPETVVLVFAVAATLASLDAGRARQGAVAGALVALGLAMSLETLPFLAALCAIVVGFWIVRGEAFGRALAWFGIGLGAALPALFLLQVAPSHWLASTCDAMGAPHLGAGLIGALGVTALARGTSRLSSPGRRAAAAMVVGALVALYLVAAYPACLGSPFAGVDPLVRVLWLDKVVESLPLARFWQGRTMATLTLVVPLLFGLVGSLHGAATTREAERLRFAAIAALTTLGLALAFWQVRVITSVTPLALCGGIHLVLVLRDRLAAHGLALLAAFAPLVIVPFTSTGLALALPDDTPMGRGGKTACLMPEALAPLASLGPGRVVAPIDLGSHLLASTALDVFAAPYHRNNDGNRFMLDVFLAKPEAAQAMLAARGATYVITCGDEAKAMIARAPDGLAARLGASAVPSYLRRVPIAGTPYNVFAVTPAR